MKRPNITPGPWEFDPPSTPQSRVFIYDKESNKVAELKPEGAGVEARAQAIAALPDLLEALELCFDALGNDTNAQEQLGRLGKGLHTEIKKALTQAGYTFDS